MAFTSPTSGFEGDVWELQREGTKGFARMFCYVHLCMYTPIQLCMYICIYIYVFLCAWIRQTDRQTDRQADRQADRQTDRRTDTDRQMTWR